MRKSAKRSTRSSQLRVNGRTIIAWMIDPTTRFTTRVDNYVKYRPSYPAAIITLLQTECGLSLEKIVADIGSGTGFLTELFLKNGNEVFGVEPNTEMRLAGERLLSRYPGLHSINA